LEGRELENRIENGEKEERWRMVSLKVEGKSWKFPKLRKKLINTDL
jgi:hypothetical protein